MTYTATKSIITKVGEYVRLKLAIDHMTEQADAIADQLKQLMTDKGIDEMTAGSHIVTYKAVISKRLDTAALKKLLGEDALEPLMKSTESKRFSVK